MMRSVGRSGEISLSPLHSSPPHVAPGLIPRGLPPRQNGPIPHSSKHEHPPASAIIVARPEMASEVWLSLLSPRLPSRSPPLLKPSPPSSSSSFRRSSIFAAASLGLPSHHRRRVLVLRPRATDQQGQVQGDEVVDSNILPYCSIDRKAKKKTLGELEQEFLQALQSFYYEKKAIMSNEEFDNLKEELMWEGSSVVMLSPDEQKLLEASMAYADGKPIMTDAEFDELKARLRKEGSSIVQEGPRCSLRSKKVYSDLTVDYFKMFLLNVPAAVIALTLFFFLDDLTGFEITYLLELPEPFSFIFTWFAALPLIFWLSQLLTNAVVKDFLILKGPCPNCGTENISFFGTILTIPSSGTTNTVKCSNCGTTLVYDSRMRLITLPEPTEA